MAGLASKLKAAGVYGFAAIGFSQTVWFGVKAMQNYDPSVQDRTKAASKSACTADASLPFHSRPADCAFAMAVEDGAMVTASLEEHLGENLRSLVLDTSVESETEYGSVRSAQVLIFGGKIGKAVGADGQPGKFGVLSSKVMVAKAGAQLLHNTLRIVEMKTTGEEYDLMPTTPEDNFYTAGSGDAQMNAELRRAEKISQLDTKLAGAETKAQSVVGELSAGLQGKAE